MIAALREWLRARRVARARTEYDMACADWQASCAAYRSAPTLAAFLLTEAYECEMADARDRLMRAEAR